MRYVGILQERGHVVDESEAYAYALQRLLADETVQKEFVKWFRLQRVLEDENEQKEFVEWFYSGNWVTEDDENE